MTVRLTLAAAAALLGLAAPAGAVGTRPGPKPANELVAFDRAPGGGGATSSIWVMTGTGAEQREISKTPAGVADSAPSLSLGMGVVVWQREAGGPPQVYGGDVFADTPQQVTDFPGGATQPSISRNGVIAASVHEGTDCSIWVIPFSDPKQRRRVTDHGGGPGCDSDPAWSPDGRRIAFRRTTRASDGTPQSALMTVGAGGGAVAPLSAITAPVSAFAWAPGSQLLLLTAPSAQLVAVDSGGGHQRVLADGSRLAGTPAWGPQASWATAVQRQADGSTDIVALGAGGGPLTNLTHSPGVSEGHPSPGYPSNQGNGVGPGVHARSVPARHHGRRRKHKRRAATAVAAGSAGGRYSGHTSQRPRRYGPQRLADDDVSFRVSGGRVRDLEISWLAPCVDDAHGKPDAPLIDRTGFDALRLRGGRFSIGDAGYTTTPGPGQRASIRLVLRGVVDGRQAHGTLSIQSSINVDEAYTADYCFTSSKHPIRWRATRR